MFEQEEKLKIEKDTEYSHGCLFPDKQLVVEHPKTSPFDPPLLHYKTSEKHQIFLQAATSFSVLSQNLLPSTKRKWQFS